VTEADDAADNREARAPLEPAVFAEGTQVAGRYKIIRFIGRGGASEVYEALDGGLGVQVALKVLKSTHARNAVQLERFRREIQSARRVTHRNVCRIFDLGVERIRNRKRFFLTMELLRGRSLAETLTSGPRYAVPEALAIVTQIAEGLQAAHDAGVVHRDLKPGNVMLVPGELEGEPTDGPRAVITDFGLALTDEQTRLTRSDEFVGTPAYMAPEQSEAGVVTAAVDVYALGLIMYEMLTAQLPFDKGATPFATVLLRQQIPPRPIREILPDLDPRWQATIHRCLEREPEYRFTHAADVIASLRGEPTKSQRTKR
jgi:serine/threonine protein kinase